MGRRVAYFVVVAVVAGGVTLGLIEATAHKRSDSVSSSGEPRNSAPTAAEVAHAFEGAPAPLADLHVQANQILPGGTPAFKARLSALRGHPVVVNKWSSTCGPCRLEFPAFQKQAVASGRNVAFLGIDSNDVPGGGPAFLREFPVTYPSYADPDQSVAASIGLPQGYPFTAFYNAAGKRTFIHSGPFSSQAELAAAIRRYAL